MKHIDVVIIGGSLAGVCARELTRRGVDAVAFEREHFPREKVCGGFLSPGAVDLLESLGLRDSLRERGARTVHSACVRMSRRIIRFDLPRPGMGVSRKLLDALVADHPSVRRGAVRQVKRLGEGFRVQVEQHELSARVVIDAAGKLSRFTERRVSPQFGVQFYEEGSRGDVLDFWFFEQGYGGAVSIEGDRSNACFLVSKDALRQTHARAGWRITGPVAYERGVSDFIAIGDAAGMVDPFCGEGIRHALDTGIRAAGFVARGLDCGDSYDAVRARYEADEHRRWRGRRRLGRLFREVIQYPRLTAACFGVNPGFWLRRLW
jgi:flavin-dependent dehydrogenase